MRLAPLILAALAWLLYAIARFVPPASLTGALEPLGTAAAVTGLLSAPALFAAAVLATLGTRGRSRYAVALLASAGFLAIFAPRPLETTPGQDTLTVMSWNVARLGGIHERDGKAAADTATRTGSHTCASPSMSLKTCGTRPSATALDSGRPRCCCCSAVTPW